MGTRAFVGRYIDSGFRGRMVSFYDGQPWHFGNIVLTCIRRMRGDVQQFIYDVFAARFTLLERLADTSLAREPVLVSDTYDIDVHYLYLFDVDACRLDVWDMTTAAEDGSRLLYEITFDDRGRSEPSQLLRPKAPWPTIPVEPFRDEVLVAEMAALWEGRGEELAEARVLLAHLLGEFLAEPQEGVTYLVLPQDAAQSYVAARVGAADLRIPSRAWREAVYVRDGRLFVWQGGWRERMVEVAPKKLIKELGPDKSARRQLEELFFTVQLRQAHLQGIDGIVPYRDFAGPVPVVEHVEGDATVQRWVELDVPAIWLVLEYLAAVS